MVTSIIYVFQDIDAVNRADLSTVVSSLTGPKRPHDHVALSEMKEDFHNCLDNKVSSCNSNFTVSYTIELNNIRYCSVYCYSNEIL